MTEKNRQTMYINEYLMNNTSCTVPIKMSSNVSTVAVNNILKNKFNNGPDMNAVVCMFDTLFLSSTKNKENGLYQLSEHVSKWVTSFDKVDVDSTSGFIYMSDIFSDIKVIIKVPQNIDEYDEAIQEYFIGVTEINKLRYIVPNFVYTFGAFMCPTENEKLCSGTSDKLPFIIFEQIPGDTIEHLLNKDLTFSEYLGMFIQILLALEVGQRTINFCHFDLHTSNVMCRTIDSNCNYTVPLDNNMYQITAIKYLPVMIDFGLSTVKHNNNIIGSYVFPEHGMLHYMLPGVDMYKFLFHSIKNTTGNLQRQILNLMSFYGKDDPYKLLISGDNILDKASDEYVVKSSYSRVTTYTPLEFLDWILEQSEYDNIISKYVKKKERNLYIPLSFSSTVQEYDNIFMREAHGRNKAIELVNKCMGINSSYIMSTYFMYVLEGYNKKLISNKLNVHIKKLRKLVSKQKDDMIKLDIQLLDKYKNLHIPDILHIKDDSKRILNIGVKSNTLKKNKNKVLTLIERFFKNKIFFDNILPFLQLVYTIKEMKEIKEIKNEPIYDNFLTQFYLSPQYKTYTQNYMIINKTTRWSNILIDILTYNI